MVAKSLAVLTGRDADESVLASQTELESDAYEYCTLTFSPPELVSLVSPVSLSDLLKTHQIQYRSIVENWRSQECREQERAEVALILMKWWITTSNS